MKSKIIIPSMVVVLTFFLTGCVAQQTPSTSQPVQPAASNTLEPPSQSAGGSPADIAIKGFAFDPNTLTIKAGTTVRWTNEDSSVHTVVGDSWKSGNLAKGESYSRVFDAPGTYAYSCGVHPLMKGTIVVTP